MAASEAFNFAIKLKKAKTTKTLNYKLKQTMANIRLAEFVMKLCSIISTYLCKLSACVHLRSNDLRQNHARGR